MTFDILTLFPSMFTGPFDDSIILRARERGQVAIDIHNIRDYAVGKHQVTDDSPYGGGAGMVMKAEPIACCLDAVRSRRPAARVVLTSPQGRPFTHAVAEELAALPGLILVCGRYEGIDERIRDLYADDDISLGDFVLTGGEIAAMAMVDAVTRLIPGVLGSDDSARADSFCDGLLEYPHYTRPPEFRGKRVPEILFSGHHDEIRKWRRKESLRRTLERRPDLLATVTLNRDDLRYLATLGYHASA